MKLTTEDFDEALGLLEIFQENLSDIGILEYEDIKGALNIIEEDLICFKEASEKNGE